MFILGGVYMTRLEMVEKVKEKTGVTYDEAHEALSRSGWDIYDALIEVGRKGGGSTAEQKVCIPENAAPRRGAPPHAPHPGSPDTMERGREERRA